MEFDVCAKRNILSRYGRDKSYYWSRIPFDIICHMIAPMTFNIVDGYFTAEDPAKMIIISSQSPWSATSVTFDTDELYTSTLVEEPIEVKKDSRTFRVKIGNISQTIVVTKVEVRRVHIKITWIDDTEYVCSTDVINMYDMSFVDFDGDSYIIICNRVGYWSERWDIIFEKHYRQASRRIDKQVRSQLQY